jgi:hypothetical protein
MKYVTLAEYEVAKEQFDQSAPPENRVQNSPLYKEIGQVLHRVQIHPEVESLFYLVNEGIDAKRWDLVFVLGLIMFDSNIVMKALSYVPDGIKYMESIAERRDIRGYILYVRVIQEKMKS